MYYVTETSCLSLGKAIAGDEAKPGNLPLCLGTHDYEDLIVPLEKG